MDRNVFAMINSMYKYEGEYSYLNTLRWEDDVTVVTRPSSGKCPFCGHEVDIEVETPDGWACPHCGAT